jgi:Protein of unknown function
LSHDPDEESPEERICSTLRWCDVSLPQSVTTADLDALILAELVQSYRKVARIVGRVHQSFEARSTPLKMDVIAARVRELAETGRIEGVGNLTMWRHSEVRLKPS